MEEERLPKLQGFEGLGERVLGKEDRRNEREAMKPMKPMKREAGRKEEGKQWLQMAVNSKPKIKKVCLEKIEGRYDNYRLLYARDDKILHCFGHKQESSILKEVPVVIMCIQERAQMFMLKHLKQADMKKLRGQLMKHMN
ncbi:hypothetical protein RJ639_032365 [Escallonia herrerae]|uniref:Uncharacterized protein n=1 Tax=Escallonia herrerae TaxID=1293975 RepID=A0AA88WTQ8_9ASTE|nr:hypothetical protein RJ639_032365 [Escallonia herrerae]